MNHTHASAHREPPPPVPSRASLVPRPGTRTEPLSGYGRALWAAVVAFCATVVALYLPWLPPFEPLEFNWQGKVLATGVAAAVIVAYPHLTWRRVGLGLPRPGWARPFAITLAAFVVAGLLLNVLSPSNDGGGEAVLFQATMPGLQEELLFRGVLFALLDQSFRRRRRLWGADVGWSLPVTAALFALVHGVGLVAGQVVLDPAALAFTAVLGLVLGWARARCGSIWPCVVLHNTWNLLGALVAAAL